MIHDKMQFIDLIYAFILHLLFKVHKIIGFVPSLLQVVMQNDVDMPVRQAGAVYLKNTITNSWEDREIEAGQQLVFSIHEQDRAMIRDSIVDAIVLAPEPIRVQLCVCINNIIKHDFPHRWTQVVDKISIYLQNTDVNGWNGALLCLYQLVKNYEYKKSTERAPLTEAMNLLLPMVYSLMINLLGHDPLNDNDQFVLLQKLILKIYYALTQYALPLDVITREMFAQWMEVCRQILDRPTNAQRLDENPDDNLELPEWKVKKWAAHIVARMFERYGSPGNVVSKEYEEFSKWYLETFSTGILQVQFKVLDEYRKKQWVSPRVLTDILNYMKNSVSHAHSWKIIKPHAIALIQDVIFPLMSFSEADQEMWEMDPVEYIRQKFDVFDDISSPVPAAESLLHSLCKTRKGILNSVMTAFFQIINNPSITPREKDGALHMIGSLADVLPKKKVFKDQVETLLVTYVFPGFQSPHGHLRARSCWVLHSFSEIRIKNPENLAKIMQLSSNALLTDPDLPVKVEAAVCIQMFLVSQPESSKFVETQVKPITVELLKIIRETENEDLTNVLQKIVCQFTDQLVPIAVEICQHLAATFSQVLEGDDSNDDRAITAMGLLNTMETLLSVMEEKPDVIASLHPIVLQVIGHILQNNINEFYEEAFSLIYDLTSKNVSQDLWKLFELVYAMFEKDGIDYFLDMMPTLYNYVTVDTNAFLQNQNYVLALFNMCKTVLTSTDVTEESECNAAKLLEVMILQCRGRINECIPTFVELALGRLIREVKTSELRTMCLQVVIAALYTNTSPLLDMLSKQPMPNTNDSILSHFVKQWIHDTDCFLGIHDRKLWVVGMCTLISLGNAKPQVLSEVSNDIIPSLILIFDGLKRAYEARAEAEEEEESDGDEDIEDDCEEGISSDEDEMNELDNSYMERVAELARQNGVEQGLEITTVVKDGDSDEDDSDDDDFDEGEETALEGFTTPLDDEDCPEYIDEYIVFQDVMQKLQLQDPTWYTMLSVNLTEEQRKSLHQILTTAEQKRNQKRSDAIEKSGGFQFTQQAIPTSFNFSSPPSN
ncbi:hypothetical protein ACKWTF_003564 [Chironomus riparius]